MKIITCTITFLLSLPGLSAQTQESKTMDGRKVILNTDGTWKYAEAISDTAKPALANCDNWIETTTDRVTGATTTSAKNSIMVMSEDGRKGFGVLLMNGPKNSLILSIEALGSAICIDQGALINILFTDGSRLALQSNGEFNCEGKAALYFGGVFGKKSQLEELKNKDIQTMRIWTSHSYIEQEFSPETRQEFHNVIHCLIDALN